MPRVQSVMSYPNSFDADRGILREINLYRPGASRVQEGGAVEAWREV